ncbi:MAG: PfkB family carbohydrate kinase [Opitutales bacterium]
MTKQALIEFLEKNGDRLKSLPVVTGFDGFVDEMISVVDERQSLADYRRIETIDAFGSKISAAAGHSSLREIVITEVDPGGCAINMGDGLATFGFSVTTFATVGEPLHAAFAEYAQKARVVSWGEEPGRTLAYEFADGKLMFSAVSQLQKFHPDALREYLKDGVFLKACADAELIAITDWTLYPHMTACWQFLLDAVFSNLPKPAKFFFDLVDPSSRSDSDIAGMLEVLGKFGACGSVTLGLNQNEANILSRLQGLKTESADDPEQALEQAGELRAALGIDGVVIHSVRYASGCEGGDQAGVMGPYCEKPKKSTGAGDRFNAGYALGAVLKLPMEARLRIACASSGSFVRTGQSPTLADLIAIIRTF